MNHSSRIINRSIAFWATAVAVFLVAFFFRFYRLADHPLGIFFDPAINGLDTIRLMQRGGPVVFFPTNGGREAFFMYLLIPYIWLFGTTPFSIRALTATISLLNVVFLFAWLSGLRSDQSGGLWPAYAPAAQRAARGRAGSSSSLNSQEWANGRAGYSSLWFAALAALALAVSYWHIAISRLGQRPLLVPMLAVPLFWFFLKGWATGRRRWFVLAGVFMGLEGHTYSAARLLPVILALALLPEFFPRFRPQSERLNYRQAAINLLIFGFTALLVYSPLAWYLLNHPQQFTARAFSVMVWNFLDTPTDIAAELGRNLWRVAAFFCCEGSLNPIFGWPGYPGSPLILLPFLLLGLAVALKNWRSLFQRLVALWWLIGLTPSIAAIEAPHPLRMIAAVVPTAILIALGLVQAFGYIFHYTSDWLRPRRYALRFVTCALPVVLIFLPVPALFRAYFQEWPRLQTTQGIYDYGAIAIRDAILAHTDEDIPIYLPLSRFKDTPLLFYLSDHFRRQAALTAAPAEAARLISPENDTADTTWIRLYQQTATLLPPLTEAGRQQIQAALSSENATGAIRTITGEIAALEALLADDPVRFVEAPAYPLAAEFGPLALTGATYPAVIDPLADKLPVTLFWQARSPMRTEYEILVRLVDDSRRAWGDGDARPTDWAYPTSFWRPGLDEIAAQHQITFEAGPPEPGRYWLAVSVFDPTLGRRAPLTAGVSDSPDTLFIGPLKAPLPQPPAETTPVTWIRPVSFGRVATLAGADIEQQTVKAGEPLRLSLLWEALSRPEVDYTVFVHLLDPAGNRVTGQDTQPVEGRYPTTIWSAGEQILDRHTVPIPPELPPGRYQVAIGLYDATTGARLPLVFPDAVEDAEERLILEPVIEVIH